ncbi:hypothetical protein [Peribacillus glennii]|uniref:Uncharacterized protein n=1 Tax=Peribacillus glennii TaxID=2303991 RepID=A0A372LBL9_9BACI|nr:hypothetical protein [Peribacillus glennii]RFU62850.1 hypothetical protein D0466_12915 [Peribacillus glennii]
MYYLEGNILSGEFDGYTNEFAIQKVKEFHTQSVINQNQLASLYEYLKKHQDDQDGQIITLYDQMPLRLTQHEIQQLLYDLKEIQSLYNG